jgi:hypothetical protein
MIVQRDYAPQVDQVAIDLPQLATKSLAAVIATSMSLGTFSPRRMLPATDELHVFYAYCPHVGQCIIPLVTEENRYFTASSSTLFAARTPIAVGGGYETSSYLTTLRSAYSASKSYPGFCGQPIFIDHMMISIPADELGNGVQPGSVKVTIGSDPTCNGVDDGNGNLFCADGEGLFITGTINYSMGVLAFPGYDSTHAIEWCSGADPETIVVEYNSVLPIYEKLWTCEVPAGELNFTTNRTALVSSSYASGNHNAYIHTGSQVYATQLGLYNARDELIAHAKFSRPIKIPSTMDMIFEISLDI